MIKFYVSTLFSLFFATIALQAQVNYSGNGNTGFGGPVGPSSLQFSDNGTTVTGTFTKGTSDNFNNEMVIYIDSKSGGFSSTVNFNDPNSGDKLRRSIAGYGGFDGASRSVVNFPSGFEADYAIAINTGFGGLWQLIENAEFPFIDGVGNPANNTDTSFTFSFDWSELGISNSNNFKFVITYMDGFGGNGVFRSDEGYGDGLPSGNPGTDDVTFTSSLDFVGTKRTIADGVWSSTATWVNASVPTPSESIVVKNTVEADVPVTINNSLTVDGAAILTISSDQILNLNGSLTNNGTTRFASDANGTAQLISGASATVTGDLSMERFIPAFTNDRRAFRFVTSPVNSSGSIYDNWQDGGNAVAGLGTHITGSTTGANGFDATTTGASSLFTFDNTDTSTNQSAAWNPIANTDVLSLEAGKGYRLFVRGDRNYDLASSPANQPNSNVTLRALGAPVLTEPSVTLNPTAGFFSLVGNPFQAVVNFESLPKTNLNPNFVYVWNANASTRGAYATIDVSGADSPLQFIQPGQSFFVETATNGAASITFDRASRAPSQTNLTTFSVNETPSISMNLTAINGTERILVDQLKMNFDGTNDKTLNDARKLFNIDESISRKYDENTFLSIESRAVPTDQEILELDFRNYQYATYELWVNLENMEAETTAILVDQFLNTETTLDSGQNTVNYTVDTSNESANADRFKLKFDKSTAGTDEAATISWSVYPNPVSDGHLFVNVPEWNNANIGLKVTNLLGQVVINQTLDLTSSGATVINTSDIAQGMYVITLSNGDQQLSRKLMIQ
ncbi:T9SS type A sorting domain-containing protein [Nonlabens marinus]|uniref:Secretion system C-terminal sorting domain-containing protein n=1 Tax=Nonlabens marinus S1-08 TaxID=1454201 RepID=W8VXI9_9FLAO|nr:T9SS type A sorting domain-containing protein [Nonlabens marinus]BAO56007.1 hypothetical protein NMS_1998 [Nonlabens marinus S1-08]